MRKYAAQNQIVFPYRGIDNLRIVVAFILKEYLKTSPKEDKTDDGKIDGAFKRRRKKRT